MSTSKTTDPPQCSRHGVVQPPGLPGGILSPVADEHSALGRQVHCRHPCSDEAGTIKLSDLKTAAALGMVRAAGIAYRLATKAKGDRLVSAGLAGVSDWNPLAFERIDALAQVPGSAFGAGISPDGSLIAIARGDGMTQCSMRTRGRQIRVMPGHEKLAFLVTFGHGGTMVVSASEDHAARVGA